MLPHDRADRGLAQEQVKVDHQAEMQLDLGQDWDDLHGRGAETEQVGIRGD